VRTVLYLRKDSNYTPFGGISRKAAIRSMTPALKTSMTRWDSLLNMSFMETRARLADIAADNYHRLGADIILNYNDQWSYDLIKTLGEGYVLPVDDDDWLPDGIFMEMKSMPKSDLYWWNSMHISSWRSEADYKQWESPRVIICKGNKFPDPQAGLTFYRLRRIPHSRQRSMPDSNAYIMPIGACNKNKLDKHGKVGEARGLQMKAVSVYLGHPASTLVMCNHVHSEQELLKSIDRMRHFDEELMPRPEFKRKLRKLKELFTEIQPKKTIVTMKA
jgi:hypothetical protein